MNPRKVKLLDGKMGWMVNTRRGPDGVRYYVIELDFGGIQIVYNGEYDFV